MNVHKLSDNYEAVLSKPVVKLPCTPHEYLTWEDLFNGVFISGGTGAGKTSGPGAWILNDILRDETKPGGLFLCMKKDERIRLEKAFRAAGRTDDMVIISKDNPFTVNALEYELFHKRRGEDVEYSQALNLLMEICVLGEAYQAGGASGGEQERFWDKQLRICFTRLMMLLTLAKMPVTIQNMRKVLVDSFSEEDLRRYIDLWTVIQNGSEEEQNEAIEKYEAWCKENFFLSCFDKADARKDLTPTERETMGLVGDYFLKTWCKISEKTRAIIESSVFGLCEAFLSGILKALFSSEMSDEVRPEKCFQEGKLIILDVPLKEYGISSIYATGIMKKLFQLCVERRVIEQEENPRPCILWADEYHLSVSPYSDEKFQSSCRSTMTAGVYITQSTNSIKIAMGKTEADAKTKVLLTNLGTHIYCANTCRDTNTYASEMIGREFIRTKSLCIDTNDRASHTTTENLHYVIMPERFVNLKSGGKPNKFKVETIMICRGKSWKTDEPFREIRWDQRGRQISIFQKLESIFY